MTSRAKFKLPTRWTMSDAHLIIIRELRNGTFFLKKPPADGPGHVMKICLTPYFMIMTPAIVQKIITYAWLCMYKRANFAIKHWLMMLGHSSEIRGLCLMKLSSKTLQNLPYFWNKKTQIVFFVFHFSFPAMLLFYLMNALFYVDIDQGIRCNKSKVARNEKNYLGFLIPKIWL